MRFMSSFSLALKSQIKAIIFTIKATFVNFEPWQFLWFFQGEKTLTFRSKAVVISELRQIGLSKDRKLLKAKVSGTHSSETGQG